MKEEQKIQPLTKLPRLYSLDLIRGIAAFFMVQGHFIYQTMSQDPKLWFTKLFFLHAENFVYPIGWPMFFLIIGIGLAISIERQKMQKLGFGIRLQHVLKRSAIFIIIQYVYNLFSYGFLPYYDFIQLLNPVYSFSVSDLIFQIAIWSLVVFFLMDLPLSVRIITAGVVAYLGYYVFNWVGNVFFYILTGGIFGSLLVKELLKGKKDRIFRIFLILGIIFFIIGLPLHINYVNERISKPYYTNYAQFIASPGYILLSLGVIWLLFATFFWVIDIKGHNSRVFQPIILWGNLTLTLYVAHYILLNQMLYNLELYYYFSLFTFQVWTLSLCIFIYIGAVFWSRYKFKYSLEWIIRKYS